jgi:hypothetical protein
MPKQTKPQLADTNALTDDEAEYRATVEECKAATADISGKQWILGDGAAQVTKKYGENRLERFAEDINFHGAACTLGRYRPVCLAFPKTGPRPRFFGSAKVLQTHPDRIQIVTENGNISMRDARAIMRKWRAEHPDKAQAEEDDPIDEEDTEPTPGATSTRAKAKAALKEKQQQEQEDEWLKDNRRWFRDLVAVAHEASRVAGAVDLDDDEQLNKLLPAVDPKMLMDVRGAGRMLFRVANRLAELLGEDLKEASAPIEGARSEARVQ